MSATREREFWRAINRQPPCKWCFAPSLWCQVTGYCGRGCIEKARAAAGEAEQTIVEPMGYRWQAEHGADLEAKRVERQAENRAARIFGR